MAEGEKGFVSQSVRVRTDQYPDIPDKGARLKRTVSPVLEDQLFQCVDADGGRIELTIRSSRPHIPFTQISLVDLIRVPCSGRSEE